MSPIERSAGGGGGGGFANPMTTAGDIIIENAVPTPARLGIGAAGQFLGVSGGLPAWASPALVQVFHSQLAADAASIDTGANGIPGGGNSLLITGKLRTNEAAPSSLAKLNLNNDAAGNYYRAAVTWNGAAIAFGSGYSNTQFPLDAIGNTADANVYTFFQAWFNDYTDTAAFKMGTAIASGIATAADANVRLDMGVAWQYRSTSAITRVAVAPFGGPTNLKSGSSLTIYTLT